MAPRYVIAALLVALALANFRLSACSIMTAKVSCLDCHGHDAIDLSGIKVVVKCDKVKKLSTATTDDDGSFKAELPAPHSNCLAKVAGGPRQLYAAKNSMVSKVTEARDSSGRSYFTTSTPLSISTTCPKETAACTQFGSSETVDLPLPKEWGLAPSSYYLPFIPIIGIP